MNRTISRFVPKAALLILLAAASGVILARPHSIIAAPAHGRAASARLTAVDAAGLRKKLAALKGKVVVLNVWATWCGPCVAEFPELVKLDRAYRNRGVTVIGLSVDDPGQAQQVVPPFLAQHGARYTVYTLKQGDADKVIGVVDKNWNGSIPVTYVLDRSGHVRTGLSGRRSLVDFEGAVQMALKG